MSLTSESKQMRDDPGTAEVLLKLRHLTKHFALKNRSFFAPSKSYIRAVDNVDMDIYRGEVFALVGESGSGKSTIGRLALRLMNPTAGYVSYRNIDLNKISGREMQKLRKNMQYIAQDSFGALDPRMRVRKILEEPLECHKIGNPSDWKSRIEKLLAKVGLDPALQLKYPHELSGGQRQRVCIARALALEPEFIVCDESVSSLDVSYQAQIINLLSDLQEEYGLTYLFISHDLRVVHHLADRIAVLYLGNIVEISRTEAFFLGPEHPYSQSLLSSNPDFRSRAIRSRPVQRPEPSKSTAPSRGCAYMNLCPRAEAICEQESPRLVERRNGRFVACHLKIN